MNFVGTRVWDALSKSWGHIVDVGKRGNVVERFRIQLDCGIIVTRTRAELFMPEHRRSLSVRLAWNRETEDTCLKRGC